LVNELRITDWNTGWNGRNCRYVALFNFLCFRLVVIDTGKRENIFWNWKIFFLCMMHILSSAPDFLFIFFLVSLFIYFRFRRFNILTWIYWTIFHFRQSNYCLTTDWNNGLDRRIWRRYVVFLISFLSFWDLILTWKMRLDY